MKDKQNFMNNIGSIRRISGMEFLLSFFRPVAIIRSPDLEQDTGIRKGWRR
jgi:hypothetical protein